MNRIRLLLGLAAVFVFVLLTRAAFDELRNKTKAVTA